MLSDRRGREYVRSLWVTVVAAVGLVLGLVVAPAATASSTADAAGGGVSAAAAAGANDTATRGAAAVDPVDYINAQNTGTVIQVSASTGSAGAHTCAVTTGNTVYCWGNNEYGRLGNDSTTQSPVPVPVKVADSADGGFVNGQVESVSAGEFHTCAVTTGNTVYCWGRNSSGQLGNDSEGDSPVPVPVADSADGGFVNGSVESVSAGGSHTCAVTTGNTVYCWGDNFSGQLGNDSEGDSPVPVKVADSADGGFVNEQVESLSAGGDHTCAVTTGNTVYCWGDNSYWQLGNGKTRGDSPVPVAVADANGFVNGQVSQVSAGGDHTCAVTTGNAVYCWGRNDYGQLGNNSTTLSRVPVAVADANGFVNGQVESVSAGGSHSCAVTTGNTVYCWGDNTYGQLGNGKFGSNHNSSVPVAVAGQLSIVPNPVEFGEVKVGSSTSKDVVVKHSFPLTDAGVVVDVGIISKPVGFSFDPRSGCTNDQEGRVLTLTDDAECTGVVKFAPKSPGEFGGIVSLTPRDYPNAGTRLSASGFAPPGANPDGAVVKASSGDFGKVDVFTAKVKNIKITNVGDEPLRITGAKIKSDADDEFAASVKDCTQDPVAPGKSCTATAQFFPRDAGASAALLDLKSNAVGGDTIALAGEGVFPVQETDAPGKVRKLRVPDKTVTAKKATAKWKRPKGEVSVTGYETRIKKKKNGNWKKWSGKDPEPNLNGWISRTFKKLSPKTTYKVQVRAVSLDVRGKKSTVGFTTDRKGIPTRPANG